MNDPNTTEKRKVAPGSPLGRSPVFWGAVAIAVGFAVLASSLLSTPIDDAYISFRYLENLFLGRGLVFNPGEKVEGYSNLFWIAFLALPRLLGIAPHLASPILELFLAIGCLALVAAGTKAATGRADGWTLAAPLLLALNAPFLFWIGKGMEVIFYGFLQAAFAVAVLHLRNRATLRLRNGLAVGAIAAAAALTRPEGPAAPAVVLVALLVAERNRRRAWLAALAVLGCAVAGQFAFRLAYYGRFWPNTYYAKRLPLAIALGAGLRYLRRFVAGATEREAWFYGSSWAAHLPTWIAVGGASLFAARRWRGLWPVALQAAVLVGVAVYVGGDWMPAFRFLVPAVPVGLIAIGAGLSEAASSRGGRRVGRAAAFALLAVLAASEIVGLVRMVRSHEFHRWRHQYRNYGAMAEWLQKNGRPGSLIAISDIGIVSYYNLDKRFLDVLGLTDPHIASLPGIHYLKTDVNYVLRRRPDYVIAMLFAWPEAKKVLPKTTFDAAFLAHVAEKNDYKSLARVRGWREGLRGERWVLFEVFERKKTAGRSPRTTEPPAGSPPPTRPQSEGRGAAR